MLRRLLVIALATLSFSPFQSALARDDRDRERTQDSDRGWERAPDQRPSKDDWRLLGEQTVDLTAERDTITVGAGDGTYTKLRIEARNNDIYLFSINVVFGNGEEQPVRVNDLIRAGERSGSLDLTGGRRGIKKVTLLYKARPGIRAKSVIALYGEKSFEGEARGAPSKFVTIATETYERRSDRIEFKMPYGGARSSELRIKALDEPLSLESIEVRYNNGRSETFNIYDRLEPGEESKAVTLSAASRASISGVTLIKRPSWRGGNGRVEMIGNDEYGGGPSAGPEPVRPGEFIRIDSQTFDRRADRISFRVDPRGPDFKQIKLRSDDYAAIENIALRFSDGEVRNIPVYDRLLPGEASQPIDIRASNSDDRRYIRHSVLAEVIVSKRPSWRTGQSRMELLGLEGERQAPSHGAEPGRAPPGWVLFGAKTVGFSVERDVIEVGADVGRFSRIALAIRDNDVFLREITLVYANGQRDTRQINTAIPANSRTRAIDIPGDRFIRQIEMVYQSRPDLRSGRAIVEVFGEYDRKWLAEGGDGYQNFNRGWLMIGAQRALMFATDTDAFEAGEQFGRFQSIRLTARRHSVRVTGLRITYGNGQVEEVPVFKELTDGQSTQDIPLRIRDRYIKRVDVRYRTKLNFQGEGLVELWGLRAR